MSPRRRSTSSATPAASAAERATDEHPLGVVDADHTDARGRDRHRDPAGADTELDDRAARRERLLDVELDVLDDAPTPRVVQLGDRVVLRHGAMLPGAMARTTRFLFMQPRPGSGVAARA